VIFGIATRRLGGSRDRNIAAVAVVATVGAALAEKTRRRMMSAALRPRRDRQRRIDVARDQLARFIVQRDLDALGAQLVERIAQRRRCVGQPLEPGEHRRGQLVLGIGLLVWSFGEEDHGGGDREQHELRHAERDQSRRQRAESAAAAPHRHRRAGAERLVALGGHGSVASAVPWVSM
jgi:hypothetical protein